MAPTLAARELKSSGAKPKTSGKAKPKKPGSGKTKYIQRKNAKPAFKKRIEDLSESDFESDEDFGMNGPEYGPLSDTDTSGELEDGIPEAPVYPGLPSGEYNEGEDSDAKIDSEDGDISEDDGKESESGEGEDDGSSSGEEIPEPEGSIEGDSDDEEGTKLKQPKRDLEREGRTIFIGNLPISVKKMKLKKWFSKFGDVESVRLRCPPIANPSVPKKVSAMQRDFHEERTNINAFLRFVDGASVSKALSANGTQWDETHNIRVDRATGGKEHDDKKAIFVGNLPFDVEENQIRDVFVDCGDISNVRIVRDRRTNVGKGFAYVNFTERHSIPLALAKSGETIGKRALRVEKCNYQGPRNPNVTKSVSQNFIDKRKSFIGKKFKSKKKGSASDKSADGTQKESFQGWQAKKREKRMKKKKTRKESKKQQFIQVLNSKSKKPKET